MTRKDQVFVANVAVIDPTQDTVALNVISQLTIVVTKLSTIVKIYKHRGLHKRHHFISMAMEVHNAPQHDMDHSIK
jgi:exosome complex RNA-binding protein Rrp42 (RNase PH superfamily)